MKLDKVKVSDKFARFDEHWSPKVIADMNDYQFKLVKNQGDFTWYDRADTDEVFVVLEGEMRVEFRAKTVRLAAGATP